MRDLPADDAADVQHVQAVLQILRSLFQTRRRLGDGRHLLGRESSSLLCATTKDTIMNYSPIVISTWCAHNALRMLDFHPEDLYVHIDDRRVLTVLKYKNDPQNKYFPVSCGDLGDLSEAQFLQQLNKLINEINTQGSISEQLNHQLGDWVIERGGMSALVMGLVAKGFSIPSAPAAFPHS